MEATLSAGTASAATSWIAAGLLLAIGLGHPRQEQLPRSNQRCSRGACPIAPMANRPLRLSMGSPAACERTRSTGNARTSSDAASTARRPRAPRRSPDGSQVAFAVACSGGCATAGDHDEASGCSSRHRADRLVVRGEFFDHHWTGRPTTRGSRTSTMGTSTSSMPTAPTRGTGHDAEGCRRRGRLVARRDTLRLGERRYASVIEADGLR